MSDQVLPEDWAGHTSEAPLDERIAELRRELPGEAPVTRVEKSTDVRRADVGRRLQQLGSEITLTHRTEVHEDGSVEDTLMVELPIQVFLNMGGELNSLREEGGE